MKIRQIFFTLIFFATMNLVASEGDQKEGAQSLHEEISRTISIDTSQFSWEKIDEFSERLKDNSLYDYNASYAYYFELKRFYQQELQNSDPKLKETDFLLVHYSYNPDVDLKEFQTHIPSKHLRYLIYSYADVKDPLTLPRLVPLSVFRPQSATYDNNGNKRTPDVFRNHGDIVHIATEARKTVSMKIDQNDRIFGNVEDTLAFLGNRHFLHNHFGASFFTLVAYELRSNSKNHDLESRNAAIKVLQSIRYFKSLVCPGDYSEINQPVTIQEILTTNETLTAELRQKLQAKYDRLIAEYHAK